MVHLNVRSIYSPEQRQSLSQILQAAEDLDLDLVVLTETWMNGAAAEFLARDQLIRGKYRLRSCTAYEPGDTSGCIQGKGVLVLIKESIGCYIGKTSHIEGHAVKIELKFRGCIIELIGLYAPSAPLGLGQAATALIQPSIDEWLRDARRNGHEVLLLGDLNGCFSPVWDRLGAEEIEPDSPLLQLLHDRGLFDLWRIQHPHLREYTHRHGGNNSQARLDYVLGTEFFLGNLVGTAIGTDSFDTGSDHLPVFAEISGIGLISRLQAIHPPARRVFDFDKAEAEHWNTFKELTDALPERVMLAMDEVAVRPSLEAISLLWQMIQSHLKLCADESLPMKTISGWIPRSTICEKSTAIRTIRSIILARRHPAGHEQRILDLFRRLCRLVPHYMEELDAHAPNEDYSRIAGLIRAEIVAAARMRTQQKIKECLDRRFSDLDENISRMLDGLLERKRPESSIRYVVRDDGTIASTSGEVRDLVKNYFAEWFGPSNHRDPLLDPEWARFYAPLDDIDPSIYDSLLVAPTDVEMKNALKRMPNGKSAGPSDIPTELFKGMGASLLNVLKGLFGKITATGTMPLTWHTAHIYPISKKGNYVGDLNNLRPITLIDTGRKFYSTILTTRLSSIVEDKTVLRGGNFGCTPGVQANDAVHLLQTAIEDADLKGKNLEVLSLDIRRAFDSVPFSVLRISMKRIKIPDAYIDLVMSLTESRSVKIITAFGLTEAFTPAKGVEQGEINAPLMWKIFYDVLLTKLQSSPDGYQFTSPSPITRPQLALTGDLGVLNAVLLADDDFLKVPRILTLPQIAFMDDLNLIARTLRGISSLKDSVESFMDLNDISLNASKTIHARRSTEELHAGLQINGREVGTLYEHGEAFRVLGVWISTHCLRNSQIAQIKRISHDLARTVSNKAMTDKITKYVYSAAILPKLTYQTTGNCLKDSEASLIIRPWNRILKHASGLPSTTSNSLLHSPIGLNVPSFPDAILAKDLSDHQVWLNSPEFVGEVTRNHYLVLQEHFHYPAFPGSHPIRESAKWRERSKYLHFLGLLQTTGIRLDTYHPDYVRFPSLHANDRYIAEVVPQSLFRNIRSRLARLGLFHLSQLRCPEGTTMKSLAQVFGGLSRAADNVWFDTLTTELTSDGRNLKEEFQGFSTTCLPEIFIVPPARPLPLLPLLALRPTDAIPAPAPVTIWTDGSLDESRTRAGCASLAHNEVTHASLRGLALSSTSAELGGLFLALKTTPKNCPLTVVSDSQAALEIAQRQGLPLRALLKKPDQLLIGSIRHLLKLREAPTSYQWVRGHNGDLMNEQADAEANWARQFAPALFPPTVVTNTTQFFWCHRAQPLPVYGRQLVKRLASQAHTDVFLRSTQGKSLADLDDFARNITIAALKSASAYESAHETNRGNSTFRAFRYKLVMGTLPTIARQAKWRPDLYRSGACMLCGVGAEDHDHIFRCPSTSVPENTLRARIVEELATVLPTNKARFAKMISDLVFAAGFNLSSFKGFLPRIVRPALQDLEIGFSLQGTCLAFLRAVLRVAYHDVWKSRCAGIITAEQRLNITTKLKRLRPHERPPIQRPERLINNEPRRSRYNFNQSELTTASIWDHAHRLHREYL